jgi:hypothetical protein
MNANFTLPKHVDFTFNIEGVEGEFTLPAIGTLTTDQAVVIGELQNEKSLAKRHEKIKSFLLGFHPELAEMGLGENDYNIIFGAYIQAQDGQTAGK